MMMKLTITLDGKVFISWKNSGWSWFLQIKIKTYLESPRGWQLCRTAGLASSSKAK